MAALLSEYVESIQQEISDKIDKEINPKSINFITKKIFKAGFIDNVKSVKSHKKYLEITGKRDVIESTENFFRTFRRSYGLQYIDQKFIKRLEDEKKDILDLIIESPFQVYNTYFHQASIRQNDTIKKKNLTSFFTKLTHTIHPKEYSAMDNPIRSFFNLKNQGFFFSYCLINETYKMWLKRNKNILTQIRESVSNLDRENVLQINKISDLKILDMIFWYKANVIKKSN